MKLNLIKNTMEEMNSTEITLATTIISAKESQKAVELAKYLHEALKDVIRQIPSDQLGNFNLDFAEKVSLDFESFERR